MGDELADVGELSLDFWNRVVIFKRLSEPVWAQLDGIGGVRSTEELALPGVSRVVEVDEFEAAVETVRWEDDIPEIDLLESLHEFPDVSNLFVESVDCLPSEVVVDRVAVFLVGLELLGVVAQDVDDDLGIVVDHFAAPLDCGDHVQVEESASVDQGKVVLWPLLSWENQRHRGGAQNFLHHFFVVGGILLGKFNVGSCVGVDGRKDILSLDRQQVNAHVVQVGEQGRVVEDA